MRRQNSIIFPGISIDIGDNKMRNNTDRRTDGLGQVDLDIDPDQEYLYFI